jgi:hypothetical protein
MNEVNTMLFADISQLIEQSRTWVATSVNTELTLLYWQVGKRIYEDVLNSQRADYNKQVVGDLAKLLSAR